MVMAALSMDEAGRYDQGRLTLHVVWTAVVAAFGGLMFGYDIGISGGVTAMDDFLTLFFPRLLRRKNQAHESDYCKFDDHTLQLFTSSLYLAAMAATLVAAHVTRKQGRVRSILLAGAFFILGVIFNFASVHVAMLIVGRMLLGLGVGFANQAVPLYLSEVAPARWRGAMNIGFQLSVTIGILVANLVNYFTQNIHPWGWRLSLGLAGIPATVIFLAGLTLSDTPNSILERGLASGDGDVEDAAEKQAYEVLCKIRGIPDVHAELHAMKQASQASQAVQSPWRAMWKKNKPQLAVTVALQVFQQLTGINAIMFYAPVLFQTVGFKSDAALYSAAITGGINVLSTLVSVALVDRLGRRKLLLEGSVQMLVAQVAIGVLLGTSLKAGQEPSGVVAIWIIVLTCVFVPGFAWSWGPMGWLIPSEIFPLESRPAGQSVAVLVNMLFTFLIAQAFLSMLCAMRFAIYFFFAAWVLVMGIAAFFLLPETKGLPIEDVDSVWRNHRVWRTLLPPLTEAEARQQHMRQIM
ncbi:hypothetical protein GOP47_0000169 [Adiantum capillus-veneris]|uniref:Major facilitator superfamily (MFS) profile domain-containing protein n=1 Tax=Adiantum capillus-veneris TaxID=13818 RepID=A0A9D4VCJ1_ADICA|nr:hypothetical protein GOP47_0000169 [Adiantum capillus-veneris]